MGLGFPLADSSAGAAGAPSMGLNNKRIEDCLRVLFPTMNGRAEASKSPEGDWVTNPRTGSTLKGLRKTFFLFSGQQLLMGRWRTQGHESVSLSGKAVHRRDDRGTVLW